MTYPSTAAQGILSKDWIVSANHGPLLLPVVEKLDVSDKFGNSLLSGLGDKAPILNTTVYNGGDFSFDFYETDLNTIYTAIYDVDPTFAKMAIKPENLYGCPFYLYGQHLSAVTGLPMDGYVAEQCLITSFGFGKTREGNTKITVKGTCTRVTNVQGATVVYSRIVKSPVFSTASDISFTGSTATIGTAALPIIQPGLGSNYDSFIAAIKNAVKTDTGFTVTASTFTATTAPATGEVWQLYTMG